MDLDTIKNGNYKNNLNKDESKIKKIARSEIYKIEIK